MAIFGFGGTRKEHIRGLGYDDRSEILMDEYSSDSRDNLHLMMIHRKIEMAARMGDWQLMNELNEEFKRAKAVTREEEPQLVSV
jgi:hypothetical protein